MTDDEYEDYDPRKPIYCKNCNNEIMISIFKGDGYCCENCRKALLAKENAS